MVTVSGNDQSGYTYYLRDHASICPQSAKDSETFQEYVKAQNNGLTWAVKGCDGWHYAQELALELEA